MDKLLDKLLEKERLQKEVMRTDYENELEKEAIKMDIYRDWVEIYQGFTKAFPKEYIEFLEQELKTEETKIIGFKNNTKINRLKLEIENEKERK